MMVLVSLVFDAAPGRDTGDVALYFGLIAGWEVPFLMLVPRLLRHVSRTHLLLAGTTLFCLHLALMPVLADTVFVWGLTLIAGLGGSAIIAVPIVYFQDLMDGKPGTAGALMAVQRLCGDVLSAAAFVGGTALGGYGLTALLSLRNGWCLLQQLAERTIGGFDDRMGIVPIARTLFLLDRKLDVDILRYSSEFGCLVRELVGAVRALDVVRLLAALFFVFVIVAPVVLAFPVAARFRPRVAAMPRRTRVIAALAACGLVWLGVTGWLVAIARNTDVDYGYRHKETFAQKRELGLERLGPGQSFTFSFESANPSDRFTVITFLDEAAKARQGERVATIDLQVGATKSQAELRAGIDTADFAIDRPESAAERAHTAPLDRAAFSFRVRDDSGQFYTARAYRSVLTSPEAAREASLTVTSSLKRGTVAVVVAASWERKIPRDPSRRRWLADRR